MKRIFVLMALAAVPAFADDVYLRGGGQITGEIIEQTEESVTVDIGGAYLTAKMSSIVRIEESISPLQEYRTQAESIPEGDVEAWRALARWAKGKTLSSQSSEAYSQVVTILPDDEEANLALGKIRMGGKWVSEEESYRSQGYIEFEREWMTPSERKAILTERRASEEANRQAIDAEVRAIEAEQKAEYEQETADREKAMQGTLPRYGDPVNWGWGRGPTYWPNPSQGSR